MMCDFIIKSSIIILSLICLGFINDPYDIKWGAVYLLFLNLYLLWITRKNIFTLIISSFLLWFNYSIFVANYFIDLDTIFIQDAYTNEAMIGYKIILTFFTIVCIFVKRIENRTGKIQLQSTIKGNILLGRLFLLILTGILIFGFDRPSAGGERGNPSTIYEYSIIIFIVGNYFFSWKREYKIGSTVLFLFYTLQNLLYGGRVTALQLLIVFFLFSVSQKEKINWKKLIPIIIVMFIIFIGIGIFRANFVLSIDSFKAIFGSIFGEAFTLDTAYSAYYTSLTFIKTEMLTNNGRRLELFFKFCLSIFLGGSVSDSNLAVYTRQFFTHYYGGVLPFCGHFYLGYIGVVLLAILIIKYINSFSLLNNKSSGFLKCFAIYIVATTPRWYLYSPSSLLRGTLIFIIFFWLTKQVCRLSIKSGK